MRFLIKFVFWMAVVFHYLPDADMKAGTPPAKVATQSTTLSKPRTTKPEPDRLDRCLNDVVGCARKYLGNDTLKFSDVEPTWRGIKQALTQ